MQFRKVRPRKRLRAGLDLTPLINIIFLLLLFLMVSSTFVVQTAIPIEVPQAAGTHKVEQHDLSITLQNGEGGPDNQGRIYVNNEEISSWAKLSERLSNELVQQPNLTVLIRPDANLTTGRLVKTLGIATSVGVKHYGIATEGQRPASEETHGS